MPQRSVSGYRSVSQASPSSAGGIAREMKSKRRSLLGYPSRISRIIRQTAAKAVLVSLRGRLGTAEKR